MADSMQMENPNVSLESSFQIAPSCFSKGYGWLLWKICVKCDLWPGQVSLDASGDDRLSDSNNSSIETVAVR